MSLANLTQEWSGIVAETGGSIWERGEGTLLCCWTADTKLKHALHASLSAAVALRKTTQRAGYQLSAGLAPGVARILPDKRRPPPGWELAGPFYLARWMMNLSAHRGRILLTEVAARQMQGHKTSLLGRISIQGNRSIRLYEAG